MLDLIQQLENQIYQQQTTIDYLRGFQKEAEAQKDLIKQNNEKIAAMEKQVAALEQTLQSFYPYVKAIQQENAQSQRMEEKFHELHQALMMATTLLPPLWEALTTSSQLTDVLKKRLATESLEDINLIRWVTDPFIQANLQEYHRRGAILSLAQLQQMLLKIDPLQASAKIPRLEIAVHQLLKEYENQQLSPALMQEMAQFAQKQNMSVRHVWEKYLNHCKLENDPLFREVKILREQIATTQAKLTEVEKKQAQLAKAGSRSRTTSSTPQQPVSSASGSGNSAMTPPIGVPVGANLAGFFPGPSQGVISPSLPVDKLSFISGNFVPGQNPPGQKN